MTALPSTVTDYYRGKTRLSAIDVMDIGKGNARSTLSISVATIGKGQAGAR
jgi:hypothetical protein